jgi:hypothetical protein
MFSKEIILLKHRATIQRKHKKRFHCEVITEQNLNELIFLHPLLSTGKEAG